jgi:hypothetical protein
MSVVIREMTIRDYCPLFVFAANGDAIAFWKNVGWTERVELIMMSQYTE